MDLTWNGSIEGVASEESPWPTSPRAFGDLDGWITDSDECKLCLQRNNGEDCGKDDDDNHILLAIYIHFSIFCFY